MRLFSRYPFGTNLMRHLLAGLLVLVACPCFALDRLPLASLEKGDEFIVETEDATLTFTLIDPHRGECWLHGQRVFLLGSTQGRQDGFLLVDMGIAKKGFKLEVEHRGQRFFTTSVKKITRPVKDA